MCLAGSISFSRTNLLITSMTQHYSINMQVCTMWQLMFEQNLLKHTIKVENRKTALTTKVYINIMKMGYQKLIPGFIHSS